MIETPLARMVVELAVALRAEGVTVPPDATTSFTAAIHVVRPDQPAEVYWAGRATLVRRPEDTLAFDRAFTSVFGRAPEPSVEARPGRGPDEPAPADERGERGERGDPDPDPRAEDDDRGGAGERSGDPDVRADDEDADDDADLGVTTKRAMWSAAEVLRRRDLATCTPDELAEAHRLIERLRVDGEPRRSRRRRPTNHRRGTIDLGRTVGRALRTGGEVTRPARSTRVTRPRRLVLLLDVSGSMEPYARSLVRFAHAGVAARRHGAVEVFTLGTRVTRITRELASHDPDEALRRATDAVSDWSGGTRLGAGLREFNDRWGVRGVARGATVILLSDGWDRGEPEVLGTEVARLHRVTHRLIWVNPLKATPGYEPLARGMAAALPHIDDFVEGHSVVALDTLARLVADPAARRDRA